MDDKLPPPARDPTPRLGERGLAEKQARAARQAAALRANLLRRKQQARDRAASPAPGSTPNDETPPPRDD